MNSSFCIPLASLALAMLSLAPASRALTLQPVTTYSGNNLIATDSAVVGRNSLVGVLESALVPSVGTPGSIQPLVSGYPQESPGSKFYYEAKRSLGLTPAGQVAFTADFTTSPTDRSPSFGGFGVFSGTPGSGNAYTLLFKNGDPAPGTGGSFYGLAPGGGYQPPAPTVLLGVDGQITFDYDINGPSVPAGKHPRGLWTGTPGNVSLVLQSGDPAPGIPGFTFYDATGVTAADGTLIISGSATNATGSDSRDGTWTKAPTGAITPLFVTGTPAPGGRATLDGMKFIATSDSGNVAANVQLQNGNAHDSIVLARHDAGYALSVLAIGSVTPVPGQPAGIIFTNRIGTAVVNDNATVIFSGGWFGNAGNNFTSGNGLFANTGQGGALVPVVVSGQAAPGLAAGTTFDRIEESLGGSGFGGNSARLALNNRGQLAFFNYLKAPGTSDSFISSLWVADLATGNLTLVAQRGDSVTLGSGNKTIDRVDFATKYDFFPRGGARKTFNDDGQLLLAATFTDGSSALLLATVPPSATTTHAPYFTGEVPLADGVYYLQFASGNPFGYYAYLSDPRFIFHFDLGYEYWFDANDGKQGIYFYDFRSGSFFYTSPSFPFPYLYDFSLNATLYYFPNANNPQRYTTDPRYFYNTKTGPIISK